MVALQADGDRGAGERRRRRIRHGFRQYRLGAGPDRFDIKADRQRRQQADQGQDGIAPGDIRVVIQHRYAPSGGQAAERAVGRLDNGEQMAADGAVVEALAEPGDGRQGLRQGLRR